MIFVTAKTGSVTVEKLGLMIDHNGNVTVWAAINGCSNCGLDTNLPMAVARMIRQAFGCEDESLAVEITRTLISQLGVPSTIKIPTEQLSFRAQFDQSRAFSLPG